MHGYYQELSLRTPEAKHERRELWRWVALAIGVCVISSCTVLMLLRS